MPKQFGTITPVASGSTSTSTSAPAGPSRGLALSSICWRSPECVGRWVFALVWVNIWRILKNSPEETDVCFHVQAPEERNYHIFYYMLVGMPLEKKKILSLGNATDYSYLTIVLHWFVFMKGFRRLRHHFKSRDPIFRVTASALKDGMTWMNTPTSVQLWRSSCSQRATPGKSTDCSPPSFTWATWNLRVRTGTFTGSDLLISASLGRFNTFFFLHNFRYSRKQLRDLWHREVIPFHHGQPAVGGICCLVFYGGRGFNDKERSQPHVTVSVLLPQVTPKELEKGLTQHSITTATESVTKVLTSAQAVDGKDAFVKVTSLAHDLSSDVDQMWMLVLIPHTTPQGVHTLVCTNRDNSLIVVISASRWIRVICLPSFISSLGTLTIK